MPAAARAGARCAAVHGIQQHERRGPGRGYLVSPFAACGEERSAEAAVSDHDRSYLPGACRKYLRDERAHSLRQFALRILYTGIPVNGHFAGDRLVLPEEKIILTSLKPEIHVLTSRLRITDQ